MAARLGGGDTGAGWAGPRPPLLLLLLLPLRLLLLPLPLLKPGMHMLPSLLLSLPPLLLLPLPLLLLLPRLLPLKPRTHMLPAHVPWPPLPASKLTAQRSTAVKCCYVFVSRTGGCRNRAGGRQAEAASPRGNRSLCLASRPKQRQQHQ